MKTRPHQPARDATTTTRTTPQRKVIAEYRFEDYSDEPTDAAPPRRANTDDERAEDLRDAFRTAGSTAPKVARRIVR